MDENAADYRHFSRQLEWHPCISRLSCAVGMAPNKSIEFAADSDKVDTNRIKRVGEGNFSLGIFLNSIFDGVRLCCLFWYRIYRMTPKKHDILKLSAENVGNKLEKIVQFHE